MLLSAADARDVAHATRMVAVVARRDRDRIAAHQRRVEELRITRVTLEERAARLVELRAAAERAQAAASDAVRNRNALIREIDRRRDLNAQLAGELLQAQQRLQATLKTLAGGGTATVPALPLSPFRGTLSWPAEGAVRHQFGRKTGGSSGTASSANGIEIVSTVGAPVRAIHEGTVAFADTFTGYGKLVIVDHGNQAFTLYGHLLDIGVARGDRVQQGQPVGAAGFALVGVPGLYFELRVDGRPVDPLQWLEKR
jgi:septal ring factor EnvC (AmiA/AmiB activator)